MGNVTFLGNFEDLKTHIALVGVDPAPLVTLVWASNRNLSALGHVGTHYGII